MLLRRRRRRRPPGRRPAGHRPPGVELHRGVLSRRGRAVRGGPRGGQDAQPLCRVQPRRQVRPSRRSRPPARLRRGGDRPPRPGRRGGWAGDAAPGRRPRKGPVLRARDPPGAGHRPRADAGRRVHQSGRARARREVPPADRRQAGQPGRLLHRLPLAWDGAVGVPGRADPAAPGARRRPGDRRRAGAANGGRTRHGRPAPGPRRRRRRAPLRRRGRRREVDGRRRVAGGPARRGRHLRRPHLV